MNDETKPEHYQKQTFETWEMMLQIWGRPAYIYHCEMSAFKYRMRAGHKKGQSATLDISKAIWFENKAVEIRNEK